MTNIVPIVVAAGAGAAGRLISATTQFVGRAFEQLLSDDGEAIAGRHAAVSGSATSEPVRLSAGGRALASRLERAALRRQVEPLRQRVQDVLREAGLRWDESIRVELQDGRLSVDASRNELGGLIAARLESDAEFTRHATSLLRQLQRAEPGAAIELSPEKT